MMSISPNVRSRLAVLWKVAKIVLAIALIGFVISKVDLTDLSRLNERIQPSWLIAGFLLYISLTLVKARQYQSLAGGHLSYWGVLRIVVIQNTLSNFVASSAGIASYLTLMKTEEGVKLRKGVSSFVVTKIGDLISASLFLSIGAALTWDAIAALRGLTIVLLLAMCLVVGIFLVTLVFRQRFVEWLAHLLAVIRLDHMPFVQSGLGALRVIAGQETRAIFHMMWIGVSFSFVYMVMTLAWAYANLRFFYLVLPLGAVIYVVSLLQFVSWFPIQVFGGLGVTEFTAVYLYGHFGIPQAALALVSIGNRLLSYLQTLVLLSYLPLSAFFSKKKASD